MASNALILRVKSRKITNLPKTELIDIVHFAEGLFSKGLLQYEDVTAIARMLNKMLRGKTFEHQGQRYRIMKALSVGKDIKVRIVKVEIETSESSRSEF